MIWLTGLGAGSCRPGRWEDQGCGRGWVRREGTQLAAGVPIQRLAKISNMKNLGRDVRNTVIFFLPQAEDEVIFFYQRGIFYYIFSFPAYCLKHLISYRSELRNSKFFWQRSRFLINIFVVLFLSAFHAYFFLYFAHITDCMQSSMRLTDGLCVVIRISGARWTWGQTTSLDPSGWRPMVTSSLR